MLVAEDFESLHLGLNGKHLGSYVLQVVVVSLEHCQLSLDGVLEQ